MTEQELDILAGKIASLVGIAPRWMKLKQAAAYSNIGQKRLKDLAKRKLIAGYIDPNSGRGDWIFDKKSIDVYRQKPLKQVKSDAKKILDLIESRS